MRRPEGKSSGLAGGEVHRAGRALTAAAADGAVQRCRYVSIYLFWPLTSITDVIFCIVV